VTYSQVELERRFSGALSEVRQCENCGDATVTITVQHYEPDAQDRPQALLVYSCPACGDRRSVPRRVP
jgi:DNA-directed RNA polymerase subunit RPC12/RpoP